MLIKRLSSAGAEVQGGNRILKNFITKSDWDFSIQNIEEER